MGPIDVGLGPQARLQGEPPAAEWHLGPQDGQRAAAAVWRVEHRVARERSAAIAAADVDEDHFPFETPLARFLDYSKGCYVGQEPVFRVHAQGNAARALRGLTVEGAAPIASGTALAAPAKGSVTSSIADGETTRALGFLHRTCWEPGGTVWIDGRKATVFELPW